MQSVYTLKRLTYYSPQIIDDKKEKNGKSVPMLSPNSPSMQN